MSTILPTTTTQQENPKLDENDIIKEYRNRIDAMLKTMTVEEVADELADQCLAEEKNFLSQAEKKLGGNFENLVSDEVQKARFKKSIIRDLTLAKEEKENRKTGRINNQSDGGWDLGEN